MTLKTTSAFVLLLLGVFSAPTFAAEADPDCDNPGVLNTGYWKEFESMVVNEYFPDQRKVRVGPKQLARAYGHALGRLAKAVQNDSGRRAIYDCVYLGIYQDIGLLSFRSERGLTNAPFLLDLVKDASMGGLDAEVAYDSGVTSVEPYSGYFNKYIPVVKIRGTTIAPPTGSPGTLIKADPAAGFGGVSQGATSSKGICDSWMTITMAENMEKACQGFVDDGYGRRPSKTDCIVCAPDDWHPATGPLSMQGGVDLPGMDLSSFLLDQAQPGQCRTACENNGQCEAWTYVKPGIQGSKAKCWLKHGVPKAVKDDCCVSGVTKGALDDVAEALLAAKACSTANLKSGKEWKFQQNVGYGTYYEHSNYLCPEGGEVVMKVEGKKLLRFSCQKGWQDCKRKKKSDGELIYPAVDYTWGTTPFSKLQVKWLGMNPRELYIEK